MFSYFKIFCPSLFCNKYIFFYWLYTHTQLKSLQGSLKFSKKHYTKCKQSILETTLLLFIYILFAYHLCVLWGLCWWQIPETVAEPGTCDTESPGGSSLKSWWLGSASRWGQWPEPANWEPGICRSSLIDCYLLAMNFSPGW